MTAGPAFEALVRSLSATLQEKGFRRRRNAFSLRRSAGWAVVEFQKSHKSSAAAVTFTINVGVALETILRFDRVNTELPPPLERCHWWTRVGFMLPKNEDTWWTVESGRDLARIKDEIEPVLREVALRRIETLLSDDGLCEYWLGGGSDGLSEIQRLRALSILLKDQGRTETLDETVTAMRELSDGRVTEGLVRGHLQRLGLQEGS